MQLCDGTTYATCDGTVLAPVGAQRMQTVIAQHMHLGRRAQGGQRHRRGLGGHLPTARGYGGPDCQLLEERGREEGG